MDESVFVIDLWFRPPSNATYSFFVSVDRSSVGSKHGPILSQEVSSLRPYTLKFINNRVQVVHCCFGKVGLP